MKQITQERLVNAINNINDTLVANSTMQRYTSIIRALAFQGLQYAVGEKTTELDVAKFTAEMTYWDAPKTKEELAALSEEWGAKINHYHGKRRRVWNLQAAHNVSGLAWVPTSFDPLFSYPWVHEDLNLLESDLVILSEWKSKIVEKWIDHALLKAYTIHRCKSDNLQPSSSAELLAAAAFYQWANVWEIENYSLDVVLGNGLDTDLIDSDIIWFCAIAT